MPVEFRADLHIHTCLSPCSELFMTPARIVEKAASLGINILAVCDHNSVEQVEVTAHIGRKRGIRVIPGMEINSSEEVHILGFFGDMADAFSMQTVVYENLQPGENDEDAFGMQVLVNEEEEVLGFNKRLLIGATNLSVNRIVELIHSFNGLAVASHIDREGFGIIGQLGFIPEGVEFDALEISCRTTMDEAHKRFGLYSNFPWITSSDAHRIEDIGRRTTGFVMEHATFEEMRLAIKGIDNRKVIF
ncbi:MAG: PHP domain-containing protein [Nitrospiraceae bacterium]|nr:MAG: PHP domain-containing protein [Nitrospiraceae bacterium]